MRGVWSLRRRCARSTASSASEWPHADLWNADLRMPAVLQQQRPPVHDAFWPAWNQSYRCLSATAASMNTNGCALPTCRWVQEQNREKPAELWTEGVEDYLTHAKVHSCFRRVQSRPCLLPLR